MIEKKTAYCVGEQFFPCIEEAQRHELAGLFECIESITDEQAGGVAAVILEKRTDVLNILTMKPSSHARARKANGATRKPRAISKTLNPAIPQA